MTAISDYTQNILYQRANEDFPKLSLLLPTPSLSYTSTQAIQIILNQQYSFLSVTNLGGTIYWEFVDSFGNAIWEANFLYVQATSYNFSQLVKLIPYYYTWSAGSISLDYPNYLLFLPSQLASTLLSYYTTTPEDNYLHPFLSTYTFTGLVYFLNSTLLYQYIDTLGLASPIGSLFLSSLRPIGLDYPLGKPAIVKGDPCYLPTLYPSSSSTLYSAPYLGYYTLSDYHPTITFYLYGDDSRQFLLQSPPLYNTQGLALSAANQQGTRTLVSLPSYSSIQSVTINQTAASTSITLS